ncbi:MAG: tetratricopeptide repeat protein [Elusimicrobia bacterium]|nr:tetratricopeptide repeat protein [Elusimicrobiota bacterium]
MPPETSWAGRSAVRLAPFLAALATAAAFLPVLGSGFVAWDDPANFLNNPYYRGFSWDNIVWMFTQTHVGNYQPLSWLSLALDYVLWGMEPRGYHLTNLLLHSANAALFCLVCLVLFPFGQGRLVTPTEPGPPRRGPGLRGSEAAAPFQGWSLSVSCLFAALFWSLHPLRVEPVAWITERRDVLSTFFLLSSLLFWLAWTREGLRRWYAAGLAAYVLSLLSKAIGMSFPVLLLILEFYPLRRRPRWKALAPFAVLALGGAASGLWSVSRSGFLPLADFGPLQRMARACYAWVFYLAKTVWPSGLSPMYEVPQYLDPFTAPYLLSLAAAALAAAAVLRWGRRVPAAAAALAAFTAAVAPALGFVQAGSLLAADRFAYIPGLALALLAGGGLLAWQRNCGPRGRAALALGCAALCLALAALSRRQCRHWKDSEALWGRVLALAPDTAMAHNNLGGVLAEQGRWEETERHARQALLLRPHSASYRRNLADVLFNRGNRSLREGRHRDAAALYREALSLTPGWADAHNNLGLALSASGRPAEACGHFQQALAAKPGWAEAYYNWGNALSDLGRLGQAEARYREALRRSPGLLEARFNLANCLARRGKLAEAVRIYEELLARSPAYPDAAEYLRRVRALPGR